MLLPIPLTILALQDIRIGLYRTIDDLGFTIEAGIGENPLPIEQFSEIYNNNIGILLEASKPFS